jgi:glycerol-3-phosphate dehydrogenase
VNLVEKKLNRKRKRTTTAKTYLKGCEIEDLQSFLQSARDDDQDFQDNTIDFLSRNYGTEYFKVLEIARNKRTLMDSMSGDGLILAQVVYGVRYEMARTLADIVFRRTGLGALGNPGHNALEKTALLVAQELNWDKKRREEELTTVKSALMVPIR